VIPRHRCDGSRFNMVRTVFTTGIFPVRIERPKRDAIVESHPCTVRKGGHAAPDDRHHSAYFRCSLEDAQALPEFERASMASVRLGKIRNSLSIRVISSRLRIRSFTPVRMMRRPDLSPET
jgi:hypothetical protein